MYKPTGYGFLLGLFVLSAIACAAPVEKPGIAHHSEGGFTNPWEHESTGFTDFLKWRWQRLSQDIPGPEDYDFPLANTDTAFLQQNRSANTLTWIGHATLLLQTAGTNILTDPQFSKRASPVQWAGPQRVVDPGVSMEDLPTIDFVIISHDHYDSLDVDSIRRLRARPGGDQTIFLVPLGLKAWFEDLEVTRVIELDWWQDYKLNDLVFTAVPAQHWSKRSPFSRNTTLWAGWVVKSVSLNFYFAGDSGYYQPMFQEIGQRLGPFDLAAIPVGAYEPRWFMKSKHLNPDDAVRVHQDVQAKQSMGMHWGTFILTDEALTEPPGKLREALAERGIPEQVFTVFTHGETRRY